jgi:formamidase
MLGLAAVQMSVVPWDPEATVVKMGQIISRIKRSFPWVKLIAFHELCVSGLVQFDAPPPRQVWATLPQSIPGPLSERLCDIASRERIWLVPGSMYERDGERVYNTALAISPAGVIEAKYRKLFPWYPFESETTPGSEFCVFDIPEVGRFGMSICYDVWFPETVRTLAWMGAEVILHPTMTPTSDRQLELVLGQASAITNQCYFIDINGVGKWGGGRSMMVDPDGRVLQQSGPEETILTEMLDLDRVTRTREYGTIGLNQLLKQLRDRDLSFPPYRDGWDAGAVFERLDKLKKHEQLD